MIRNFAEAKHKMQEMFDGMNEIRDFLNVADNTISALNVLKGSSNLVGTLTVKPAESGMPASMTDRVILIFQEAGKPLPPKRAVEIYASRNWPRPADDRELYTKISSTIAYLAKRKGTLVKVPEGYRIKE